VHNEFHGQWERMCAEHLRFNEFCWYNSISLAISEDGGKSYTSPSPSSLVFAPPYIYGENAAAFGYFEPSNIIQHSDGYVLLIGSFFCLGGGKTAHNFLHKIDIIMSCFKQKNL